MSGVHVTTTINGDAVDFVCPADETLLDVLAQSAGLTGAKEGCGTGDCGACSVILDGRLVCSCLVLGAEAQGRNIETIEGMADGDKLHPLAAPVHLQCRASMRHLHARLSDRRQEPARNEPRSDRRGNPLRSRRQPVPLHRI